MEHLNILSFFMFNYPLITVTSLATNNKNKG